MIGLWVSTLVALGASALFAFDRYGAPAKTYQGRLASGATYIIQVPPHWNGELGLYSHGYVPPGFPNLAQVAMDSTTRDLLLEQGYALAGSSYSQTGYAVEQAIDDQAALDSLIPSITGLHPTKTIVWGRSLGGLVTAALVQRYPTRFDGALPLCGVLGGSVWAWNGSLDLEFGLKTLLAPTSSLQLVHITDGTTNAIAAERVLADAQRSPTGRARVALVASLLDLPGWFDSNAPEPDPTDYDARESEQSRWIKYFSIPFYFGWRQELEARSGGNPSWNAGVDYRARFENSMDRLEVEALYERAGLDLQADLAALQAAPRVTADPAAVAYLRRNIDLDRRIRVPVLTVHTTGDGLVSPAHESQYAHAVEVGEFDGLLQQRFVHRAGHCAFSPAEIVAAFDALDERIHTDRWGAYALAAPLNAAAARIGHSRWEPAFVDFYPRQLSRNDKSR